MSAPSQPPGWAVNHRNWIKLGALSLVAVMAGLILPRFMDGETPAQTTPPLLIPASTSGKSTPEKKQTDAAPADDLATYTPPAWPDAPDAKAMLVRLGLGTVLVLALCVGTLWIGKRWLNGGPAQTAGNTQLKLVERLPLGNRCFVYLLQVESRQLLVGVDASGMKTLVTLPESFENRLTELSGEGTPLPGAIEPGAPTLASA